MAGKDFGGTMKVRTSNGRQLSIRGTFTIQPGRTSTEAATNQDGSVDRILTPKAATATFTLVDKDGSFAAITLDDRADVTIVEDRGVAHLFTQAFWTGDPDINRLNGEVTGLGLASDQYRRLG